MTTEDFSKGQGIGQSQVGPVPHLGHQDPWSLCFCALGHSSVAHLPARSLLLPRSSHQLGWLMEFEPSNLDMN